jgi:integrase/recombinase XerC/integrase/recombinase XerD
MEPHHTLPELIDLYLLRCEVEGKSPRTVRAYRETLSRFSRVVSVDRPHEVTSEHLYAYLGRFTHLRPETRHRYFREVRCFFNWLVEAGYLERSPFKGMRNVRVPQRIVQPLSAEQVSRLLEHCGNGPMGLRDRALVMTLLDTGARCSEVVQLDLADLDLVRHRLRILHAKGDKQRVVPFAERCEAALRNYLEFRGPGPGPLFLASNGHGRLVPELALQPNGLKQMLRRLGKKAGIPKVHAHRFRHTFATWAIGHDARELDVQYLLGHSSPDMVRRYSSSYRSEQAALRHANFSPGDQMLVGR